MKCEKCGNVLSEKSNFCRICGTPVAKKSIDVDGGLEAKKVELTGNIDMSKIVVEKDKGFEDFDDETLDETGDFDKKLEAMREISKPENIHQLLIEKNSNVDTNKLDVNSKTQEELDTFQQFKIDSMPGEVCEIKLQSTKELEDMIASELMKDEKLEDTEATMLIPDSLTDLSFKEKIITAKQELNIEPEKENELKNSFSDDNKKEVIEVESDDEKQNIDDKKLNDSTNDNLEIDTINIDVENVKFKNNKSSKLGYIILTIIIIVSLFVTTYLYTLYLDSQKDINRLMKKNEELLDDNKQNQQFENMEDSNMLYYDGYVFEKNGNTIYKVLDDLILIEKDEDKFFCSIRNDVSFETIKNKMESYKDLLEKQNLNIKTYGTKMIDERSYVVFEATTDDDKVSLIAYTKVTDSDIIGVVVQSQNNEIDYNKLESFNEIINTIKKDERWDGPRFNLFKKSLNE